jgi:aryl-alcohol dehydrogenase-like predicted oxidoreductase
MNSKTIPGLEKPASRLVLGMDNQTDLEASRPLLDDFVGRGGNAFDTAYTYKSGACEILLGQYLEEEKLRDSVVILGKGAHTPHCTPDAIGSQLEISLERLRTDFVDVYMMHRDNPDVPVGEFIDALNAQLERGRFRAFGGSNWSLERVVAANEYAASKGSRGFAAVSNQFSLAKMIDPVWAGCISSNDSQYRAWLEQNNIALMPWSSQSRGFFVLGNPKDTSHEELVRCWYGPENFKRLERANLLAQSKGVETINIALAYVLHQPFVTFPLIGPRSVAETASSFRALEIELSADEMAWLNLETDVVPGAIAEA